MREFALEDVIDKPDVHDSLYYSCEFDPRFPLKWLDNLGLQRRKLKNLMNFQQ